MEYTPFDPFFVSFFWQFGFNAKNSVFPHSSVCKNYAFAHSSCAVFIVVKHCLWDHFEKKVATTRTTLAKIK